MTLRGEGSRDMTLKVATATGCEGEKGIMRIPYLDMRAIVRNTVNVCGQRLAIEQELSLSVCLKPVCLHHR